MEASGNLSKMRTQLGSEIEYTLRLGNEDIEMNDYLGSEISLVFNGVFSGTVILAAVLANSP